MCTATMTFAQIAAGEDDNDDGDDDQPATAEDVNVPPTGPVIIDGNTVFQSDLERPPNRDLTSNDFEDSADRDDPSIGCVHLSVVIIMSHGLSRPNDPVHNAFIGDVMGFTLHTLKGIPKLEYVWSCSSLTSSDFGPAASPS